MNLLVRRELVAARELLEVRLLGAALAALLTALELEHPTLVDRYDPGGPPTLRAARRVVACASALRAALRAYRVAVRRSLASPPLDDDLPF